MSFKVIDMNTYYRRGVFEHFSKDCKSSLSITKKIDVTKLFNASKESGRKFYINFLYCLCKVINSRDDYKLSWDWENNRLICYDKMNPTQYIFHKETETFTVVYTEYDADYKTFYDRALADATKGKERRDYGLDSKNHPNWFDASCMPWLSYDSMHLELPDGYLYLIPIVNWGKYEREGDRLLMPVTIRMNHASADGYLVSLALNKLQEEADSLAEYGLKK